VERVLLERRDEEYALLIVPFREQIAAGRRLLADQQLARRLVAGRLERELDARTRQAVIVQVCGVLVDDARDLERGERGRNPGRLGVVGLAGGGLRQLPRAALLLERRRFTARRADRDLLDLVGLEAGEHLLLLGRRAGVGRLLPGDEVNVGAE